MGLYPAALSLSVYINANYHFGIDNTKLIWQNSFGGNVRLGDLFFAASNYKTGLALPLFNNIRIQLQPEAGVHYLFNLTGRKSLSIYAGFGIAYKVF
ncbi:MAG: hypothetical protein C0592_06260 [Marinilabiliales bacterium]|nr:MAG: hypothetical protein C0592_06260 [Marinilabiliales bacterium]